MVVMKVNEWVNELVGRYDAIFFDVGNTLVEQSLPSTPIDDLVPRVLSGVTEAIAQLHGKIPMGLVSNTSELTSADLRRLLYTVGLSDPFSVVVATAELGTHKPDPAPLLEAARQMQVIPERCLYVGDNETDREAARRASMAFCYTGPHLQEVLRRFTQSSPTQFERARRSQPEISADARRQCEEELAMLAKPPGSLGSLESAAIRLAGIQHKKFPTVDPVAAAIFVADHGLAEGDDITPWPWTITRDIARLMAQGKATASVFARVSDVYLDIVNVGIATGDTPDGVRDMAVQRGSRDIRTGNTMTSDEVLKSLEVGVETATRLIAGGARTLCVGEVGIGNTTVAAALISWCTGLDPLVATGYGSGIPQEAFLRKQEVVMNAVASVAPDCDALEALQRLGGLEIVAMTGFMIEAASLGVPVIVDGVITLAAACMAERLCPGVSNSFVASHESPEPATVAALEFLSLEPLLNLGMRVGEGTGAIAVVPLLRAMCLSLREMARLSDL